MKEVSGLGLVNGFSGFFFGVKFILKIIVKIGYFSYDLMFLLKIIYV